MAAPRPATGKRACVLLVEDNEDARIIYTASLRHAGYEVVEAPSLKEARAAAIARRPDVVVLDCRLPDGDGLELLAAWRRAPDMLGLPVVVVTASRERQDLEAAVLAGADIFVAKPCPGDELALHVGRAISGARTSDRLRTP